MRALLFVIVIAASACGEDEPVDLSGMYRVEMAVGSAPCGTDATIMNAPPYMKLTKEKFFGQSYFSYATCTDEAGEMCTDVGGLLGGFTQPVDNGWTGFVSFTTSAGEGSCYLGYSEQSALFDDATMTTLTIETTSYAEMTDLPDAECDPDEAQRRGTAMPCLEHELYSMTAL